MSMISTIAPPRDPVARLWTVGAGLAPLVLLIAWILAPSGLAVAAAVFAGGLALAARSMARAYPHDRLGGANIVTALRLALAAGISAAVAMPGAAGGAAWGFVGIAVLALCLDGIDGWLARRQGLSSAFGARFDMEVDSGLAAILALVLLVRGVAGPELIVLGAARYAFVASARVWPWLDADLPGSLRRKTVCVIQIATLVALAAPVFPETLTRPVALTAAALVAWSFAIDIRWLARHR